LDAAEIGALVTQLVDDLAGQPSTVAASGNVRVMDAGITVLGVRTQARNYAVSADALDELRDDHAYPRVLYAARDLLGTLADKVTRTGTPYTSTRIRFFAQPAGQEPTTPGAWPHGVLVPTITDQYGVRHIDLAGGQATTIVERVPAQEFNWT